MQRNVSTRDKRDSNLRDKSTKNEWFERKSRLKSLILRAIIELNDFIVARLSFLDFIWEKNGSENNKDGQRVRDLYGMG